MSGTVPSPTLLLLRTDLEPVPEEDLVVALGTLGVTVRHAVVGAAASGDAVSGAARQRPVGGSGPAPRVLRAGNTSSRWRRPLLRVADRVAPAAARTRYALAFDPWFRSAVRRATVVVVLGDGGDIAAALAHRFAPDPSVRTGTEALREIAREQARAVLAAPLASAAGPDGSRRTGRAADLLPALTVALGADDPLLATWATWHALEEDGDAGRTDEEVALLCGRLLERLGTGPDGAHREDDAHHEEVVRSATLALQVLFHPALHDRTTRPSPLVTDPDAFLAPVRATALWRELTSPVPAGAPRRWDHERLQVLVIPGADPAHDTELRHRLQVAPTVRVAALPRPDLPGRLRGTEPTAYLVGRRLAAGRGHTGGQEGPLADALRGDSPPDVVLVPRAARAALGVGLLLTGTSRLVVHLEEGDLVLPWVHLLDWDRVTAVTVDDGDLLERLRRVVGDPVRPVPGHVLGSDPDRGRLPAVVLGQLGELVDLSADGRHQEALDLARAVLTDPDASSALLQQAAQAATRAGEPSLRLALLRRWAQVPGGPYPRRDHLVRQQEGRLRELTPGWRPGDLPATAVQSVPGRVLHLLKTSLPHRTSGYAVRSFYLLRERARAGTDVLAVTTLDFPEPGAPDREVVGEVTHLRLLREQVPEGEHLDEHQDALARALLEVVREHRPAVLHAHSGHRGYDLALAALAVGRATGIPVVYEVRGFFEAVWTYDAELASRSELYRLRRAVETSCLAEADAVVTLSESMRADLLARPAPEDGPPVDPDRVLVVPNGVDTEAIRPRPRRADLVERHGLAGTFTFGYVSNLDHPREGQELLVEAVRLLRDRGVAATAVVVGGGDRREELEELAQQRGVAGQVVFTGAVPHEEVGDHYALLDVFVVPRTDERAARLVTPLKPYEAMATGLPVVVSDLPALREIIGDDERGLAFPPGDAHALADVLDALRQDPGRRRQLADAGREWVRTRRTWQALAARYDEVYARALTPRGSTPADSDGDRPVDADG
ncbi:glycosyltransferase family 4 protein [Ornithinimicrobium sp. LYQ92]|uniref:glycosyltransferase family 4 protein n=1 Tax=Serinicoccus sp. LYQ92 TaxID=3378798 RepID=UPI003852A238